MEVFHGVSRISAVLVIVAGMSWVLAVGGCIGDVPPLDVTERHPMDGDTWQLTFNPGHDRAPRWIPNSDTIIYSANTAEIERGIPRTMPGYDDVPPAFSLISDGLPYSEGALFALHSRSGFARTFLPALEVGLSDPLVIVGAALTRDGHKVAYLIPRFTQPVELKCSSIWASCLEPGQVYFPTPIVRSFDLYYRDRRATAPHSEDTSIRVFLEGKEQLPELIGDDNDVVQYDVRELPFHAATRSDDLYPFGPDWSPGGDSLVFSDGLGLKVWDHQTGSIFRIPGTEDGVSPAWGPDGEWIAYTKLLSGEAAGPESCDLRAGYDSIAPLRCVTRHWVHTLVGREIHLTTPDGSQSVELGSGRDPAWSSDGKTLYFVRSSMIWARDMTTEEEFAIPDTEYGREPVPSPDGRYLAFSRRDEGSYHIWVHRLRK